MLRYFSTLMEGVLPSDFAQTEPPDVIINIKDSFQFRTNVLKNFSVSFITINRELNLEWKQ